MAYPSDLVRTKNWGTETLTDADLEGQYDLIIDWVMAALNSSSGHKHDGTSNEGPKIALSGMADLANLKVIGNTSGAATTPSAVSVLDEDDMASDDAASVATQQSIKAYAQSLQLSSILDYGSSASVSTAKSQENVHIAFGKVTINANSDTTISNLPYGTADSYVMIATFRTDQGATEAIEVVQSSGSSCFIHNNGNDSRFVNWMTIGT